MLRGHLMGQPRLDRLVQLAAQTGVSLAVVWHSRPPADWARLFPDANVTVTTDLADVLIPARHTTTAPAAAAGLPAAAVKLPGLPRSEVLHFRADVFRTMPVRFCHVDALYGYGLDAACTWLTGHPDYTKHAFAPRRDPLLPWYLSQQEEEQADAFMSRRFGEPRRRTLTKALLCLGDWPGHRATEPTRRWSDGAGLRLFLAGLVLDCPSPQHALAVLRGAEAGFLLHGLLLSLPKIHRGYVGPGFTTVPFTPRLAARIHTTIAHPVRAGALAAALGTGAPTAVLRSARIGDLSPAASMLSHRSAVSYQELPELAEPYPVPAPARPFVRAARTFWQLQGLDPAEPLFKGAVGTDGQYLHESAQACGVGVPSLLSGTEAASPWHHHAEAWWLRTGQLHPQRDDTEGPRDR